MSDKEFSTLDDLSLPKATVQKIISEILPHLSSPTAPSSDPPTFSRDARDLLITCSLEFIRMLSSESNDISEKESKKTIAVEHITQALTDLGFPEYCDEVVKEAEGWKQVQKGREKRERNKIEKSGLSERELERMQEEMFRSAREKYDAGSGSAA